MDGFIVAAAVFFLFSALLCLGVGLLRGGVRDKQYPEWWRCRTRYLRWLSMGTDKLTRRRELALLDWDHSVLYVDAVTHLERVLRFKDA